MKNSEEILRRLKDEAQKIEIPKNLEPEQMKKMIKQHEAQKTAEKQKNRRIYRNVFATAACFCIVVLAATVFSSLGKPIGEEAEKENVPEEEVLDENIILETAETGLEYPQISYEDIYTSMSKKWAESEPLARGEALAAGIMIDGVVAESAPMEEAETADMEAQKNINSNQKAEYGETNVQTAGVDEGDIVKNDGRYLYQKIQVEEENVTKWVIQIIDTQEGIKEVSRVDDIDSLVEFYVWKDTLVVIEEKYLNNTEVSYEGGVIACYKDVVYFTNYYHEISFFNIEDRSRPIKINTFTLDGQYASSRIADGYFYGFSKYYADPGNGSSDYDAYIPVVDGIRMQASRIYLPEENDATSYLVLVAIDLNNPTKFTDTTAIVSEGDMYYVSAGNIYVADTELVEFKEGWSSNTTKLLKFSYEEGKFALKAMGEVKGSLEGSFSMDEYNDYLRVVSTVWEYKSEKIVDDRSGEIIGYSTIDDRKTNAIYVLDKDLEQVGEIEGLAEDEQIYSARFMGDTGYFVTFRQTDPLFTVDLKDPENPTVLSELKVSGFSEYLHIYGEDRLLGIGMEADEETGVQQGMKLSMFDISDKTNVDEITKYRLKDYNYSEALYNHRAVMISPQKNIFGFEAEGSNYGEYWRKYFVFTYEDDSFVQKLKVDAKGTDGNYYSVRGTFIGDTFYLLVGDGSVQSYNLNTGKQLESLEP